jgi:hypothetical protein
MFLCFNILVFPQLADEVVSDGNLLPFAMICLGYLRGGLSDHLSHVVKFSRK